MLTGMKSGRGWQSQIVFNKNLVLVVAAKKERPNQLEAFKEISTSQAFTVGKKKTHVFL